MGQVVLLRRTAVAESTYDRAQRKIARQKKTIAKLKADLEWLRARNDVLKRLLNEPLDEVARLRRELMRLQAMGYDCVCIPARSDVLRAR